MNAFITRDGSLPLHLGNSKGLLQQNPEKENGDNK